MSDTGALLAEPLDRGELCPPNLVAEQEAAFARDVKRMLSARHRFVRVACPACGGGDDATAFEKSGFRWARCAGCATLFMSPRPGPEVMAGYYAASENYRFWATSIFPATEPARRRKLHQPRLELILELCQRQGVHPATLLEIGAGFGSFAALARDSGAFSRVVVLEPTPEMAAACRARGLEVIEGRVEDGAPQGLRADLVVAFEVIEHLFDVRDFLARAGAALEPGGLLVLTCPNGAGFDIATLGAQSPAVDPEHVNLFNPAALSGLLAAAGYVVIDSATPGRLDAQYVRQAALEGHLDLREQSLLRRVLLDEWERLGPPFQRFLAEHGLSSHMWCVARRLA
jgi:SAM-dependent methyltransferase